MATKPPSNQFDIRWVTPADLLRAANLVDGVDLTDAVVCQPIAEALSSKLSLLYGLAHGDTLQFEDCFIAGLGAGLITRTQGESLAFTFFAHNCGRIYVSSQVTPTQAAEVYPLVPVRTEPVKADGIAIFNA